MDLCSAAKRRVVAPNGIWKSFDILAKRTALMVSAGHAKPPRRALDRRRNALDLHASGKVGNNTIAALGAIAT